MATGLGISYTEHMISALLATIVPTFGIIGIVVVDVDLAIILVRVQSTRT